MPSSFVTGEAISAAAAAIIAARLPAFGAALIFGLATGGLLSLLEGEFCVDHVGAMAAGRRSDVHRHDEPNRHDRCVELQFVQRVAKTDGLRPVALRKNSRGIAGG